jgi:hypothetical protein
MTKSKDGVLPRSDTQVRMLPGTPTPRSDSREQATPRGDRTHEQVESTRGNQLPSAYEGDRRWTLVKPERHKG